MDARLLVSGATGEQFESRSGVRVDFSTLGYRATVSLHDPRPAARYGEQAVSLHIAPNPPGAALSPNILLLGDSTSHYAGALLDYFLQKWGYTPNWIGTLTGEAEIDPQDGVTVLPGIAGEAKPGHALADFTYKFTSRVSPLAPGGEAGYLADGEANQRLKNCWLRDPSGEPASAQRNGQVLDPGYYITRFGLAVPGVLAAALGTNDIRDCGDSVMLAHLMDEYRYLFDRWFASYPDAPIVTFLPGAAEEFARSQIWTSHYVPAIKGLIKAAADATAANAGTGKVRVAPTWAVAHGAGYDLSPSLVLSDAHTGATMRQIADPVHATDGTRVAEFKMAAAYLAAAAAGVI